MAQLSQEEIDTCIFCEPSDDNGGDGGQTDGGEPEDCLDDNGVPVPLDDPNYDDLCGGANGEPVRSLGRRSRFVRPAHDETKWTSFCSGWLGS